MPFFIIIFIIILLIWIFILFKYTKKYKVSKQKIIFFNGQLKKIIGSNSYKEQLIDIDKLYHKILLEAGYKWSFWEILKQKPSQITDLDKIWELHKLRNKLVHEFDFLSDKELWHNTTSYIVEIKKILNFFW